MSTGNAKLQIYPSRKQRKILGHAPGEEIYMAKTYLDIAQATGWKTVVTELVIGMPITTES